MGVASRLAYVLAASVIATILLFIAFSACLGLIPGLGDRLELGILLILLQLPVAGVGLGIPIGWWLHQRSSATTTSVIRLPPPRADRGLETAAEDDSLPDPQVAQASGSSLRRRRSRSASTPDGVTILVIALLPGLWSALLWSEDWIGNWRQIASNPSAAVFFLGPVAATIGLVVGGISIIRQANSD